MLSKDLRIRSIVSAKVPTGSRKYSRDYLVGQRTLSISITNDDWQSSANT